MSDTKKISSLFKPHLFKMLIVVLCNILSTILSLFSISVLAPFLSLIFNQETIVEKPTWSMSSDSLLQMAQYYLEQFETAYGIVPALLLLLSVVFVSFFLCKCFAYLSLWLYTHIRVSLVEQYRLRFYTKILHLPLSYFATHKKGDIISRAVNDVQELDMSVLEAMQSLLNYPLVILFYIGALFFINIKLTLFVFVAFPLVGFIISKIQRKLKSSSKDLKEKQADMTGRIEESIYALRVIKAFNAIANRQQTFAAINQIYTKLFIKTARMRDLSSPTGEFLGTIMVVIILLTGSVAVLDKQNPFSAEMFITYIVLFTQIINPIKSIVDSLANIKKGTASMDRIEELLSVAETQQNVGETIADFRDKIEFKHIVFGYKKQSVLTDVDFTIFKGQKVAVCGKSGVGKTTIVDLLLRYYDIEQGEILIDGKNIQNLSIDSLRALFGVISQDSIMFNDTIYNNVKLNTPASENEVIAALKTANAYDFVLQTEEGLSTNVGDMGNKLSGGQKQRLSIARALLKNAPILIMDEATSALDSQSEQLVQEAIDRLSENKTCIIIAHRLSTIVNADHILVLDSGKVVEQGTHKQMLEQNGFYAQMVKEQSFQ